MKKSKKTTTSSQLELFKTESCPEPSARKTEIEKTNSIVNSAGNGNAEHFTKIFNEHTTREWTIIWNNNRSVMVSYSANREPPVLRIQQVFTKAPDEVIIEIAKMVESKRRRKWSRVVNLFVSKTQQEVKEGDGKKRNRTELEPKGEIFNLLPLFQKLNKKYFDGEIKSRLGWMNVRVQRRVSIKLGSYSEETDVIRIHPALDNKKVPQYVIESILHHEMTHAKVKSTVIKGRRVVHGKSFYEELARYKDHEKADEWIKQNMGMLLPKRKKRTKSRAK